jgi:crotonobetainyl-CoA:carnitine CoA-transferase CaiB-like acyl-CoA transferase
MGNPEWATEEIFQDRVSRGQNMGVLKALMSVLLSTWKVQGLYRVAQSRRIPFAPINTMQQLYENEHLGARKFFVEFNQPGVGTLTLPGAPSQYSTINWSLRRPAPRIGEHTDELAAETQTRPVRSPNEHPVHAADTVRPLESLRVLDFSAGPDRSGPRTWLISEQR